MGDAKTGVAVAALLTMSGVTMSTEKKLVPDREPKPKPRRKLKPTEKERKLLGKLSEQERKAQETYKRRVSELKAAHTARVREVTTRATDSVCIAKAIFDSEARKLSATLKNTVYAAEKEYAKGMECLRTDKATVSSDAEKSLDAATQASARLHETEAAALTDELNAALTSIFAEREVIEYGDKAGKGKGS